MNLVVVRPPISAAVRPLSWVAAREEITAIAVAELRQRVGGLPGDSRLDALAAQVAAGDLDPFTAADELVAVTPSA